MERPQSSQDTLQPKPVAKWKKLFYGLYAIPVVLILFNLSVPTNESFSDLEEARLKYDLPEALHTFPAVGAVEGDVVENREHKGRKIYRLFGRSASKEKIEAWFQENCGKDKPFIGDGFVTDSDQMRISLYSRSCEVTIVVNEVSKKNSQFMLECRSGECDEEIKAILDSLNESKADQSKP